MAGAKLAGANPFMDRSGGKAASGFYVLTC